MVDRLSIKNFAQIGSVDIDFADLTVLVGAQGTGKSLALQWLKTAIDHRQILRSLGAVGFATRTREDVLDGIFGEGMRAGWSSRTRVAWRGDIVDPIKAGVETAELDIEKLFFVPAHRALLIATGWALPFHMFGDDTPVVARIFSQVLHDRLSGRGSGALFPAPRLLASRLAKLVDAAVFHGASIGIRSDARVKSLLLKHGKVELPFMTWTAGQREFAPLLMGLYHLLAERPLKKRKDVDWVVIEEPEMGLHPQAVTVVVLLVLELLVRGYRVTLSTHSPHLLTAVWMIQRLKENKASWRLLCEGLGVDAGQDMKRVATSALAKDYRVYLLEFGKDHMVTSKDISRLDPGAEDEGEAGWGGLTGFSSRFGEVVRKAVNGVAK